MYNMHSKTKKLSLKYSYLSLEYLDIKLNCDSVENDIRSRMKKLYPKAYKTFFSISKDVVTVVEAEKPNDKDEAKNKDLRKLYRKIATKTHPDKTNNENTSKIFLEAASAYQENNLGKLIELSNEAKIEDFDLLEESVLLLEKNIVLLERDINNLKATAAWTWYNSTCDKEKDKIIQNILISKGIKLK